ncbi:glycosyl transferase family protein [Roseivivax sp. CAU 1761]
MSLAPYVRILGRGQGRARSLTFEEAREAMALMLGPDPEPEALGAILMLLRMKGETADEIAGLTAGARAALGDWPGAGPGLDWPSYAAGRTRGLPWFLLAARLVAAAGVPVLLHGWNSHQAPAASVRGALGHAGIPSAGDPRHAADLVAAQGIAYLPLEALSPGLMRLLQLRAVFGLRSCVNTVLRMLNPGGAAAAVQGVFHPPYREIQRDAAALLGLERLTVLKGGGGEFEHHPVKDIQLFGLRGGAPWEGRSGTLAEGHRRLGEAGGAPEALAALWQGRREDDFALAVVLGTAALALETAGLAAEGEGIARAEALWQARDRRLVA